MAGKSTGRPALVTGEGDGGARTWARRPVRLPPGDFQALIDRELARQGVSFNQFVVELLAEKLGISHPYPKQERMPLIDVA